MKRNIYTAGVKKELFERLERLNEGAVPVWGRMNVHQMVHHMVLSNKIPFGEFDMPDRSNMLTRTLVKWLFLGNKALPGKTSGKLQTLPEVDVIALGIATADLATEKERYRASIERMFTDPGLSDTHTLFGSMSRDDWGHLIYAHNDHHFTQFGV